MNTIQPLSAKMIKFLDLGKPSKYYNLHNVPKFIEEPGECGHGVSPPVNVTKNDETTRLRNNVTRGQPVFSFPAIPLCKVYCSPRVCSTKRAVRHCNAMYVNLCVCVYRCAHTTNVCLCICVYCNIMST